MKKRTLWKMFLLEIVTLGIYRLYFFIKTRKEMMALNPAIKIKSPWFLLGPILLIPTLIIFTIIALIASSPAPKTCVSDSSYSQYSTNDTRSFSNNCSSNYEADSGAEAASAIISIALWVSIFVAFVLYVVWIWSYSHGVEIITQGKISFALALVITILVPDGIDILLVQEYFNKIGEPQPHLPPQPPVAPVPHPTA
jgi:hypothetical protein